MTAEPLAAVSSEPAVEFWASGYPVFNGDGIAHVVFPDAIDFEVALGHTFEANTELFDHAARRLIARNDRYLESVESKIFEGEAHRYHESFGGVLLTGMALVYPVANVGILKWSSLNRRHVHLTDKLLSNEYPETKTGT